ncbi:endoplasmic reticulum vesicle transporter-domain-containing protein [Lactifluus subvellereus]|nr:endoplasmic reticulum vesicle transporter-domain-containing protein [Lactifluus subvellereus]
MEDRPTNSGQKLQAQDSAAFRTTSCTSCLTLRSTHTNSGSGLIETALKMAHDIRHKQNITVLFNGSIRALPSRVDCKKWRDSMTVWLYYLPDSQIVERAACVRLLWFVRATAENPPGVGAVTRATPSARQSERAQCVEEHWSDQIQEQSSEGCNVAGLVRVNKVVGNIHITPGHSFKFRAAQSHIYDFEPYLKNDVSKEMRERLGIYQNPLDEHMARTSKAQYMFHYFLKIVSTQFRTLDGEMVNSHQYSVTHFERDPTTGQAGNTNEGLQIHHGTAGMPGVFFSYEISPIIAHRETRQSFAHFLTLACAIVGGVLTVGSILDSALFATQRSLKKSAATKGHVSGKLM